MAANLQKITAIFKTLANHGYETRKLLGSLATLKTTTKLSIVEAINELFDTVQANNGAVNETKVNQLIDSKLTAWVADAPAEFDTLKEVADKIKEIVQELLNDDTALSNLLSKLGTLQTKVEALENNQFDIPDSLVTEIENILTNGQTT